MINDLLEGVQDLLQAEKNLLDIEMIANNSRLDVYRDKHNAHQKFKEILKEFVYEDTIDEDGVLQRKSKYVSEDVENNMELVRKKLLISKNTYEAITNCSSWFQYETDKTWSHHKVIRANRCKHKFCPHCSRASALRRTLEVQHMMEELHEYGYEFIFLTLTSKNITAEEVPKMMSKMNEAVNQRFLKYKAIKKRFHGTIRKFELTRNVYKYKHGKVVKDKFGNKVIDIEKKRTGKIFNPHLHLIVAVKKSYFKGENYMSKEKFRELWKKALKVEYLPILDIQRVKRRKLADEDIEQYEKEHAEAIEQNTEKKEFVDGSFEIGKYIAKSSEYLESSEIFEAFFKMLFKRRNWTFTGLFKKMHKNNKGIRFESLLEKKDVEYIYKVEYNHDRINNEYYMTKLVKY